MDKQTFDFATRAVHAGLIPDKATGARALPIYESAAYVFDNSDDAAARFALRKYGEIYSRIVNPTVAALEERVASLEGGLGAVATASGLSAQFITFIALASQGDEVLASSELYGGSITQLDITLRRLGIDTKFIDSDDPQDYAAAITERTRFIFVEAVANPSGHIADIESLAAVAHAAGIPLVVDSTVATPYLLRPIEHGADIVVHSATKFLSGSGTVLGGVVVDSGTFHWGQERFPEFFKPVAAYNNLTWSGNFNEYSFLTRLRAEQLRDVGPALSAYSAFLIAQGIETLPLRVQRQVENTREIAEWLEQHPQVESVNWAGLETHAQHDRALKYFPNANSGSVFSFTIKGGRAAGKIFIDSLNLLSHVANIGDVKSLAIHPASTTHAQLSAEQLREAGIEEGTIRLSIGIESAKDLIADIAQALETSTQGDAPHSVEQR
ncbi:O-acetylhomoserine aminocarboxypropyltransferase/cysteine synthase family protein [Bifidobacterium psychraerophilum]|uniref:O-acetylhomoserine aminocarboxypropyltransferase/cysteine synthase family protein n=1 Tax=Bifidobacterium psychraerophilum TaxID=218140 RepID=UPI0023EF67B5|nr:O-acetylhomoserine aminocarboxypropyltransferase/cysteine synthase family protein [Bifidobacterium psychraerophilum]MCI1660782.1 O-acetylhomoserine aminocarboxypropyltransferase/cysteine synthase [Bifidobacterium psychraerophilum]MCI1804548.1 O-acetylhomoserine aminocarboxypropyltransferase/cysteine synthase [Bifidobacterium psychraerophilum]MCI2176296.1 O-acetylhomoserine aminocarboxypropyltransferase/cysteine synthase [Bifidobacterium psychraerophilum]MCI2181230.1 O-acetylhomoserine aminoc